MLKGTVGLCHSCGDERILLPVELLFWIGFALPVGPPLGLARALVLLLDRRAVRQG